MTSWYWRWDRTIQVRHSGATARLSLPVVRCSATHCSLSMYARSDHMKPAPTCLTLEQRTRDILATHDAMRTARRITLFGGGLVGVELAAEILDAFPDTPLTFRQREPYLLPGFPTAAQEYARRFFQRPGRRCELIFNNTIPPFKYQQEVGELVFNCTGIQAVQLPAPAPQNQAPKSVAQNGTTTSRNSNDSGSVRDCGPRGSSKKKKASRSRSNSFASSSRDSSSSSAAAASDSSLPFGPLLSPFRIHDRTGLVCVDSELRVVGHTNVYALGDVMVEASLLDEPAKRQPKVAYQAELQAWAVSENLKREAEGEADPSCGARPLLQYPADLVGAPSAPTLVCCSLGRRDGIVIFNSIVVPGLASVLLESVLERSKMNQLRGGIVGTMIWTVRRNRSRVGTGRRSGFGRMAAHISLLFLLCAAAGVGAHVFAAASALSRRRQPIRRTQNCNVILSARFVIIIPNHFKPSQSPRSTPIRFVRACSNIAEYGQCTRASNIIETIGCKSSSAVAS